jgi:anthranilate synthase component 1
MKVRTKQTSLSSDPAEVFSNLVGQYDNCFLLETLGDGHQPQTSGQSYIGVAPKHCFTARGGQFYVDGRKTASDNTYESLRASLQTDKQLPSHYNGGLVGYMSHEAMRYAEPTLKFPYVQDFYDFQFGEYEDGLIFKDGQPPDYFYYGSERSVLYQKKTDTPDGLSIDFIGSAKTQSEYRAMVEQAREDIRNGRVFQVVLANKYEYQFKGELFELYKELRRINPSPFMFFLKFGDVITMGASPELLVHTAPGRRTYLEALAGTIKRGKSEREDALLVTQLLQDEKEIAEHNMLVDLYRNDVGRVSRIGSVKVDNLKYVKKLSHVQHICSLIAGELAPDKNMFDALLAAFPAGTLVGTPKIEAAKMIIELERYERGPYGGCVGYFGYNGDSLHAVNIRAVNAVGSKLLLHTGSGIVYDSQPDSEYREISHKKAAMDAAMKPFLRKGVR